MRSAPGGKLGFYGGDHLLEDRKVAVVQTMPPGQLPASLNRIQRGTVGRQVVPLKAGCVFLAPRLVESGVVVSGVPMG